MYCSIRHERVVFESMVFNIQIGYNFVYPRVIKYSYENWGFEQIGPNFKVAKNVPFLGYT